MKSQLENNYANRGYCTVVVGFLKSYVEKTFFQTQKKDSKVGFSICFKKKRWYQWADFDWTDTRPKRLRGDLLKFRHKKTN